MPSKQAQIQEIVATLHSLKSFNDEQAKKQRQEEWEKEIHGVKRSSKNVCENVPKPSRDSQLNDVVATMRSICTYNEEQKHAKSKAKIHAQQDHSQTHICAGSGTDQTFKEPEDEILDVKRRVTLGPKEGGGKL